MFVDRDGKKVDVALFDVTNNTPDINASEQRLVSAGEKIPTVNNSFQVLAHGNNMYMRNVVEGKKVAGVKGQIKDAATFDNAFSNNTKWNNGKNTAGFNLILYSCNTGRGKNSLAAKISAKYEKINVIAPTRQMWTSSISGVFGVYGQNDDGTINRNDPGYWLVYQKGKVVEAYDATWVPGTSTKGHKVDLKDIPANHYNGETAPKEFNKDK